MLEAFMIAIAVVLAVIGGGVLLGWIGWRLSPERKGLDAKLAEITQQRQELRERATSSGLIWRDCPKCGLMLYGEEECVLCEDRVKRARRVKKP